MQTVQQRTQRMMMKHLTATPAGKAITLAGLSGGGMSRNRVRAQDSAESPFAAPVDVINYALTLEHLEAAFYRIALDDDFGPAIFEQSGFESDVRERIIEISRHEAQHVEALTAVVEQLGGEPVEEAEYDFGYTDLTTFLATAATIEGVGVAAYTGAAQFLIEEDELLTAALTIHGVEARHASYLNVMTAQNPFPEAFEAPLTPDEVLEIATPFFVTG